MIEKITYLTRLLPGQIEAIDAVRQLRVDAIDLRTRVSKGSYGEEEVRRLWNLAANASFTLNISNPELAERAGLGSSFFATLVRDKRTPKLQNFLRALTVMLEVADERLADVENERGLSNDGIISSRIQRDHAELIMLALSLSRMAQIEIDRLDAERPNDPDTLERHEKQKDILRIFADGFDKIASALSVFAAEPQEPILLGRASEVVNSVGALVTAWFKKNGAEVADWAARLPVLAGGISLLGLAGADMVVGTTVVSALVGGDKVLQVIKGLSKSKES